MGLLHAASLYLGFLCCLLCVLASHTGDQRGESMWCVIEDVKDPGMPIPSLPEQYSTNIELNFENLHFTSEVKRTLDRNLNRSVIEIWARNRHVKYITLQNESTFLTIEYKDKGTSCSAKKITGKNIQDLYSKEDKVIAGALIGLERLVSSREGTFVFIAKSNVKGIYVQQWQTCSFVSEINDAVEAEISFADISWTPSHPVYPAPISGSNMFGELVEIVMKIPGKLFDIKDYTNIITADFTHFLPFAPADDEFQPPEDVHCTDFRTSVERPTPQNYFRYSAEIIKHVGTTDVAPTVSHRTVYYDYKAGLVRIDLQDPSANNIETTAPLGTVVASVIQDFKAGIKYTIDPSSGICNTEALKDTYDVFGTKMLSNKDILEPKKYFYLDSPQISYLGKYPNRGLTNNVFSSAVKINDTSTILWWYFTEDKVQLIEDERVQKNVLVKMVSKPASNTGKAGMTEINFYNFVEREPGFFTFDVTSCYNETLSKTFILSFPGDMNPFMERSTNRLKEKVHKALKESTGLSQTRISVQEVILTSSHLYAQFTLIDVLPLPVKTEGGETTLNEAVNKLQTAVSGGTLRITLPLKENIVVLKADPSGLREYSKEENTQIINQGLSQGSVVGLALGMIFLGFLIGGAVVSLIISRKHGVSLFQNAGFGNSPTTFNNPLNESSM